MSTQDQPQQLHRFYTKYLFIPIEKAIPLSESNVLFNQLSEALNASYHHLAMVHSGPEHTLSIRIAYRAEGDDPDDDLSEQE